MENKRPQHHGGEVSESRLFSGARSPDVVLQGGQLADGIVAVVGDSDNSFSSRWVKFGSRLIMVQAAGAC